MEDIVHVKSITIKQIIAISNSLLRHYLPCPAELANNEIDVPVLGYPVQKNRLGAVVEWEFYQLSKSDNPKWIIMVGL